jgi:hypothetical protein
MTLWRTCQCRHSTASMVRHTLHAHPYQPRALQLELEATGQGWLDEQQQLRITLDSTLSALSERCILLLQHRRCPAWRVTFGLGMQCMCCIGV